MYNIYNNIVICLLPLSNAITVIDVLLGYKITEANQQFSTSSVCKYFSGKVKTNM